MSTKERYDVAPKVACFYIPPGASRARSPGERAPPPSGAVCVVGDDQFNVDYYVGGNRKQLCCNNDDPKYCEEGAVQDCGGGCSCGAPVTFNPPGYFMANSEARNLAPGWRVEANDGAGVTDEECNNAKTNQTTFTQQCHYVNDATSQTAWFRCDDNPKTPTAPAGVSECEDYAGRNFLFSIDNPPPEDRFRECWCAAPPHTHRHTARHTAAPRSDRFCNEISGGTYPGTLVGARRSDAAAAPAARGSEHVPAPVQAR